MAGIALRALIVGSGIAGLAAALAFERVGIEPDVIEREPAWAPLSSGMFIQSNGLAMLDRLGILDAVLDTGFGIPDDRMPVFAWDGPPITVVTYPRLAGPDVPAILGIKRVALHELLVATIRDRGIPVRLGTTIASMASAPGVALAVTTSDGVTSDYDVVVGADGIRSTLRGQLFPDRREPTYSGFGAWRCICPRPPDLRHKIMLIGPGARLGIMPISDGELYMFGITREPAGAQFETADMAHQMRTRFERFQGAPTTLFRVASAFHYTAVEEVSAVRPWSSGRVVVVGDAAHATTPFMGQGASMALEDAIVLADVLKGAGASGPSIEGRLGRFEERRHPRVDVVQLRSLAAGQAWGGDGTAYSPERLSDTMQRHVDDLYAMLAGPV